MIKTEKKKWTDWLEDERFINTIFCLYLKRTGQWKPSWEEVVGARMHYRENEWDPRYDGIDGDFVELFILDGDGGFIRKTVLFSDFLTYRSGLWPTAPRDNTETIQL